MVVIIEPGECQPSRGVACQAQVQVLAQQRLASKAVHIGVENLASVTARQESDKVACRGRGLEGSFLFERDSVPRKTTIYKICHGFQGTKLGASWDVNFIHFERVHTASAVTAIRIVCTCARSKSIGLEMMLLRA